MNLKANLWSVALCRSEPINRAQPREEYHSCHGAHIHYSSHCSQTRKAELGTTSSARSSRVFLTTPITPNVLVRISRRIWGSVVRAIKYREHRASVTSAFSYLIRSPCSGPKIRSFNRASAQRKKGVSLTDSFRVSVTHPNCNRLRRRTVVQNGYDLNV